MMDSLYIAQSGLNTSRYAVDVTSNNIANENTDGYIKRVVNTSEISGLESDIGNGVSFDGVTRSSSVYLYDKLVSQSSMASYYDQENSILSNVEIMFSETETSGLSTTLSSYFDSVESLRSDPTNLIYQSDLSTQAQSLVDGLQSINNELNDTLDTTTQQLNDQVDTVNNILEQIVYLNKQMLQNNTASNDLLDKRDSLEKELSNYVDIEVDRDSSTYNLKVGGVSVIFNNTNLHEVSVSENNIAQKDIYNSSDLDDSNFSDGDEISITLNNTTTLTLSANVSGSSENELKQQIVDAINTNSNFSNYTAYLDTSNNLIIKSNEAGEEGKFDISISAGGTDISKNSSSVEAENNVSLAVYNNKLSLTGGSLKAITQELTSSTSNIYSYKNSLDEFAKALVDTVNSSSQTPLFKGSSVDSLSFIEDNVSSLSSNDLENLAKIQWDKSLTIGGTSNTSFSEFYQNLLVTVSSNVENNNFKLESQNAIVNSLQSAYDNITKVDPDQEMINLLQYQSAYEANAKVITAVDEMLQTLLAM
ncbi:MAG: flagellar basal body rod C-terminal domain-containing protein [Aliarcobacter sp.]|nr:flagellar basal body rod C-terminal domain-containing protein [Aliarcobacter sp.]MDD2887678.1 flagellar basal body rod C-terminal domain-containing protein [Aliarcobacter sp.]